jgi:hypothetical protein
LVLKASIISPLLETVEPEIFIGVRVQTLPNFGLKKLDC